ncbi:hypothetical protein IE53DRAFT_64638 [Violaceomyces palustris]|uniref:Uncharacterized protein n=1 Tax=Violaceomyces palustris TaxID=1673888 RepID=A0ACD0P7H0_9BASI|nr:hypothetical protein IE53DRAFT_64638 [Violaceomyces palustris]
MTSTNQVHGSSQIPKKADSSSRAPEGSTALASEMAATSDARRDRAQAISQGDVLPPLDIDPTPTTRMGFGLLSGYEQGLANTPGEDERKRLQGQRNQEFAKEQPDLGELARTSAGKGAQNSSASTSKELTSSGTSRPIDIFQTAASSRGVDNGTGAWRTEERLGLD